MQPDGELNPVAMHERDESMLGDFERIMDSQGNLTPEYHEMVLLQHAQARSSALDLAEGGGLLGPDMITHCESEDHEEWDGVVCNHPNDDRRRPVAWEERQMLFATPPYDGYASYGRTEAWAAVIRRKDRITAIEGIRDEWDRYEHLGEVPALVPRSDSAVRGAGPKTECALRPEQ